MSARIRTWHGALDDDLVAEVRRLTELAGRHDGVEPLGEQTLLDLAAADADHVLAADGSLVGYGQLGPARGGTRTAELVVAPDSRDAGLGGRVLAVLLELAGAGDDESSGSAGSSPGPGSTMSNPGSNGSDRGAQIRLWAHGSLPAASVLARRAHLTPVRELWRMAHHLTPREHTDAAPDSPTALPPAPPPPAPPRRPHPDGPTDRPHPDRPHPGPTPAGRRPAPRVRARPR